MRISVGIRVILAKERLFKCTPYAFKYTVHASIRHISAKIYRVRICDAYHCA